jgi:hypothetical protein
MTQDEFNKEYIVRAQIKDNKILLNVFKNNDIDFSTPEFCYPKFCEMEGVYSLDVIGDEIKKELYSYIVEYYNIMV